MRYIKMTEAKVLFGQRLWDIDLNSLLEDSRKLDDYQCSRLKPSNEFHFEGLSNFKGFESKMSIQEYRNGIQNSYILNLCMNYTVYVSSTMWRNKNQPSNSSTSCSDNALHLHILVAGRLYWGLRETSSFSIWGCVLKGYFERGIF